MSYDHQPEPGDGEYAAVRPKAAPRAEGLLVAATQESGESQRGTDGGTGGAGARQSDECESVGSRLGTRFQRGLRRGVIYSQLPVWLCPRWEWTKKKQKHKLTES